MEPKIERLKTVNEKEIKKWDREFLQARFLEIQEIARDGNIIIQKLQYEKNLNNKKIFDLDQRITSLAKRNIHKNEIIKSMAEEIFIRRAYAITCEADIERLKRQIIEEHENKVYKRKHE